MGGDKSAIWAAVKPHLGLILLILGLALIAAGAVFLFLWLRKRKAKAAVPAAAGAPLLKKDQLVAVRKRFLAALPWRYRATVKDFPGVVVMGPTGSGKSQLIDLEVDWHRQANQFLPSDTSDPLIQIYLGPDSVVYELAAPLLEDGSPEAREALRRLWKDAFRRQPALVALVLDAPWLRDTPPDVQRRVTQLMRGKINTIAEVTGSAVETRIAVTYVDLTEGYPDFARLLRDNRVPFDFDLPPRGQESSITHGFEALEQYLAAGLATLSGEAFERLEGFFARGGSLLSAVSRFVSALWEGGTLAAPPRLSKLYFSAPGPDHEPQGALAIPLEESRAVASAGRYRRMHLIRCALLFLLASLPAIAAYVHFYEAVQTLRARNEEGRSAARDLDARGRQLAGEAIKAQARAAMIAYEAEWKAKRLWPPLEYSFVRQRRAQRERLAANIRDAYLLPWITACVDAKTCRPEHKLYMLGVLYAARDNQLGGYMLQTLAQRQQWAWPDSLVATAVAPPEDDPKRSRGWTRAVGVDDSMIEDYIIASEEGWDEKELASLWSFNGLTFAGQLADYGDFLARMAQGHYAATAEPELTDEEQSDAARVKARRSQSQRDLDELDARRQELQTRLNTARSFYSARYVLELANLVDASRAELENGATKPPPKDPAGVDTTLEALDWLRRNGDKLQELFAVEEAAYAGVQAARQMKPAELLTLSGGVFAAGGFSKSIRIDLPEDPPPPPARPKPAFELKPPELSRELLAREVKLYQADASSEARDAAADKNALRALKLEFDTRIQPLVADFSARVANAKLDQGERAGREDYVRKVVDDFAGRCRAALHDAFSAPELLAPSTTRAALDKRLTSLEQSGSPLAEMLRDVAALAGLSGLDNDYYKPLREALASFIPVATLMKPDKSGAAAELTRFAALVSSMHAEMNGRPKPAPRADTSDPAAADKPQEPAQAPAAQAASGQAPAGSAQAAGGRAQPPAAPQDALAKLLSPLGRVALPMLRQDPASYLFQLDAWLDANDLVGSMREPFRQPFESVRDVGAEEIKRVVGAQWARADAPIEKLRALYPFRRNAAAEVDPAALDVLRPKDGHFWEFVGGIMTPLGATHANGWTVAGELATVLPPHALDTVARLDRLARVLWDDEGKKRSVDLQVQPLQLPPLDGDNYITMSYLRCGRSATFGFNQTPSWRDFPVSWWDQETASVGVELRSKAANAKQYRSCSAPRSSWSCFRVLEAGYDAARKNGILAWEAPSPESAEDPLLPCKGATTADAAEVTFSLRGGPPWAAFRWDQ